jgi:rod shape-determining protein MreC
MFFLKNYKTIIFVVVLLAVAIILLSYNIKQENRSNFIKKTVLEAAAPVQNTLNAAVKGISDAWSRYIFLVGLVEENKKLNKKINVLKTDLNLYQEGYLESQRLKKLLSIVDDTDHDYIAARVIGREQASLSKVILINKGSAQGLAAGMPVLAQPGIIGRVTDVSWHSARVLLLIDESSNIDALVQRNRTQGIIRGAGSRGCILKYVSKTQDVKEGDTIVSSGIGGVFPKGIIIGTVNHVDRQEAGLFLKISMTPAIDFSKLEEVLILSSKESGVKID